MKLWAPDILTGRAVAAFVAAALINIWLGAAHPLSRVPTANLDTGEVARAIQSYRKAVEASAPDKPRIAWLGSSLVLAPVMQAEANLLGVPVERMTHRRSAFLEQQLGLQYGSPANNGVGAMPCIAHAAPQAYCLAIGGEMVSDDFLLVKHVLEGKCKPDAIVFGIAPRDMQDNTLPGVQSTESFQTLASFGDAFDLISRYQPPLESCADIVLGRLSPLWRYRSDLKTYLLLRGKKVMEACLPWVMFDKYGDTLELKPRRHGQFPEEVHGTPTVSPGLAMMHATAEATRFEYIRRYNPPDWRLFDCQFSYLDKLLSLCTRRNIKVAIVNMPLSNDNLALMPEGFYAKYSRRLQATCQAHNTRLLDMCCGKYTDATLYADGVHLNSKPSQAFLAEICRQLQPSSIASSPAKSL